MAWLYNLLTTSKADTPPWTIFAPVLWSGRELSCIPWLLLLLVHHAPFLHISTFLKAHIRPPNVSFFVFSLSLLSGPLRMLQAQILYSQRCHRQTLSIPHGSQAKGKDSLPHSQVPTLEPCPTFGSLMKPWTLPTSPSTWFQASEQDPQLSGGRGSRLCHRGHAGCSPAAWGCTADSAEGPTNHERTS